MTSQTQLPAARPRRILLVDDEVNQLMVLKAGLGKLPNCEVAVATGGRQALSLLAQQTFDLLITDYRMPEMDGLTLATAVHQQCPSLQIIMLTAFGNEVLRGQVGDSPIQLVLEKPIDIRHVRSAAWQILNRSAGPNDSDERAP